MKENVRRKSQQTKTKRINPLNIRRKLLKPKLKTIPRIQWTSQKKDLFTKIRKKKIINTGKNSSIHKKMP